MITTKQLIKLFLLIFTLTSLPLASFADDHSVSYLYVQRAKTATLEKTKKNDIYTLTLHKMDPYVIYFSDRPVRKSGLIPTSEFFQEWNAHTLAAFKNQSPNVGIVGIRSHWYYNGRDDSTVWSLSDPAYQSETGDVVYQAHVVGDADKHLPAKFKLKHVAIFIDPFCPTCRM